MSYLVKNVTGTLVTISDLRVQIPPVTQGHPYFDLEAVAYIDDILRSKNLKEAFEKRSLQRVVQSRIRLNRPIKKEAAEPPVEKTAPATSKQDTTQLVDLLRQAIREELRDSQRSTNSIAELMSSLRDRLNSVQTGSSPEEGPKVSEIDLANLQRAELEKLANEIETSGGDKGKRIAIREKDDVRKQASELD